MIDGSKKWVEALRLADGEEFDELNSADQIDVACDAFETLWQDEDGPSIEQFLQGAAVDAQTRHRLIEELIPLEFDFSARPADFSSYFSRFPDHALYLARFFSDEAQQEATEFPLQRCGKYALLEKVGQGSFGVVYRGYDRKLDRFVAVKLPTGDLGDASSIRRFLREAKNAGRLCGHPGIVAVHSVGEDDEGRPYLVSDFVEGETLSEYLADRKQLNLRTAASLLAQISEAVDYAHQHNIVHRDLKPSNIMLEKRKIGDSTADATPDDSLRPRVLDFGLARRQDADASASLHGSVIGTPAYMSPEQARAAGDVDHRADIYSLGAILYELMFGERCFPGESFSAVLLQVMSEEPKPPAIMAKSVPQDLVTICLKCLNKAPKDRYASASDLADDLRRWLRHQEISVRPRTAVEKTYRWVARNRSVSAAITTGVLLIVTAFAFAVRDWRQNNIKEANEILAAPVAKLAESYASRDDLRGAVLREIKRQRNSTDPMISRRAIMFFPDDEDVPWRVVLNACGDASVEELVLLARQRKKSFGNAFFENIVQTWPDDGQALMAGVFLAHANASQFGDGWLKRAHDVLGAIKAKRRHAEDWAKAFRPVVTSLSQAMREMVDFSEPRDVQIAMALFDESPEDLVWLLKNSEARDFLAIVEVVGADRREMLRECLENLPPWSPWHELPEAQRPASVVAIKEKMKLAMACTVLDTKKLQPLRESLGCTGDPRTDIYFIQHAKSHLPFSCVSDVLLACDISHQQDSDLFYAAVLAASQFEVNALGEKLKSHLFDALVKHRDPGVHSAVRYTLCRFGHGEDVRARLASGEFTYEKGRQWFYSSLGICMIVIPKGTYLIPRIINGKRDGVWEVQLPRTVAIAATELTEEEFSLLSTHQVSGTRRPKSFSHVLSTGQVGMDSVVDACRLADVYTRAGSGGCFPEVSDDDILFVCDLGATGHRIPTLGEEQVINYAGALTPFYFGTNEGKADGLHHGVSLALPEEVASYIPNRFGFFDTQGGLKDLTLTPFNHAITDKWARNIDARLVHLRTDFRSSACGGNSFYTTWSNLSLQPVPGLIDATGTPRPETFGLRFVRSIEAFHHSYSKTE